MGRLNEAARMIENFLMLNDQSPELNYNLAQLYNMTNRLTKALKHSWRATDLDDEFKDAFDLTGNILFKLKDFDNSVRAYNKVLEIDPKDAMGYYNLGCVYWALSDWMAVIKTWEKCLEVDPNHEKVLEMLPKVRRLIQ